MGRRFLDRPNERINEARMTTRTERLVLALQGMSDEIEPKLHLVSHEARDEWRSVRGKWLSDGQLHAGAIGLTEGQLEVIEAKVRRFRDIVQGLPAQVSAQAAATSGAVSQAVASRWGPSS
jgi:hypothetical protein